MGGSHNDGAPVMRLCPVDANGIVDHGEVAVIIWNRGRPLGPLLECAMLWAEPPSRIDGSSHGGAAFARQREKQSAYAGCGVIKAGSAESTNWVASSGAKSIAV
ncbi:hypothetical protein VFPBJ_03199 [Purpureocillium lilacinum]|uniref:Uncharacterized protein n=1 Tax=Purpureocillium lilacinum TaxID=33203 RepID=A0A179H4J4_PURLI|nr:hypothetical protein VFPBJ_03199 [Purpureocillium lilacinum]